MDDIKQVLRRPTFVLKLMELLLAIIIVAIVGKSSVAYQMDKTFTVSVTIHGFIIINLICIASNVMKTNLHQFIALGIACLGGVMYFAAGGIMLETYSDTPSLPFPFKVNVDYLLGAGIIALINGCVYLVDAFFSFKETTQTS